MDYLEKARKVIAMEVAEAQAVGERLGDSFVRAVEAIRETVENRGKIVVLGVGKSGHIGEKIAATLTSTGSPAVVLNSLNALHGDLGVVNDGDIVLALSASGETEELIRVLPALKRFDVRILAMTGGLSSTLAKSSDIVLDVAVSREACPLNLAPTSSTTAMLILGDALAMVLLEARGFAKQDFAKFHPGGSLGRSLLLKVQQIMRDQSQIPIITQGTPILQVIRDMTKKRCGAAVIVDSDNRLAGIFTHGDFARHYPSRPDIGQCPVDEFMTRQPITIAADRLAAEVLQVLNHHRIDDLVVLDNDNHPIGMVDSQDLSRLKVL